METGFRIPVDVDSITILPSGLHSTLSLDAWKYRDRCTKMVEGPFQMEIRARSAYRYDATSIFDDAGVSYVKIHHSTPC